MNENDFLSLQSFKAVYDANRDILVKIKNPKYSGEVGNYLESLFNIKANNKNSPDYEGWELKTTTPGEFARNICALTCSLSTRGAGRQLLSKYGDFDAEGIPCLKTTLGFSKNEHGLKIFYNKPERKIEIHDNSGKTDFYWEIDKIVKNFNNKYKRGLIVVHVNRFGNYFKFSNAFAYTNFNSDRFIELIMNEIIKIQINLDFYKSGKYAGRFHDHGMAFHINEDNLPLLFADKMNI